MKIHTSFNSLKDIHHPVVTIGTFDGVHLGHKSILHRLGEIAQRVGGETVLLSFYPHPRMVLHPEDHGVRLLNSPEEKAELLNDAGLDHLIIYPFSLEFSRLSAFDYVRDLLVTGIGAHTVVIGHDHRFGRNREGDHNTLLDLSEVFGFAVEEIAARVIQQNNVSSTKIREALKKGNVDEASTYLGYNYSISGIVVHGNKIGRTLGYPTANIKPTYQYKLIPARGIYAVYLHVRGERYRGVLSIGVRPTVGEGLDETIEVYILDFDKEIYGETVTIDLLRFIREEKQFDSLDELRHEIDRDIINARECFS